MDDPKAKREMEVRLRPHMERAAELAKVTPSELRLFDLAFHAGVVTGIGIASHLSDGEIAATLQMVADERLH